jgi:E3 Ubiquitin ligase
LVLKSAFIVGPDAGSPWLPLLGVLGVTVGVFLFLRGFRMLQYKRLILNTPFSKIRSASMGLVEVNGTPAGPQTIAAAITRQPCYYYRARAWQFRDSGRGRGEWAQVIDESLFVPFFLEDMTGKVLINPQGATLDVHRSFSDELRTSSLGTGSPVPEPVRSFVASRGLIAGEKVRLEEQIIKPGFPLFVFGTLGENSGLSSWAAQRHLSGTQISLGSSAPHSINLKFTYRTSGSDLATKMMTEMLTRIPGKENIQVTVNTPPGGGPAVIPDGIMKDLQRMGIALPPSVTSESMNARPSLADSHADGGGPAIAVSTQVSTDVKNFSLPSNSENLRVAHEPNQGAAGDFDLNARVAIAKGAKGNPFTISSQSQREVVQALAWKAALYIWGSPIFALICLYFLVVYWSWR